jgi:acyl-CoA synthetase (AMP-forming)/AMP-acid ligase II/thioesterase domain-containing protein
MFALPKQFGGVEDCFLSVRWDPAVLAAQVERRAVALSQIGIGRGSVVATLHGGSIHFFADLFAAWTVGATVACLDSNLTEGELQRLIVFTKAAALCIDHETTAPNDLRIPVLKLADAPLSTGSTAVAVDPGDPALVLFTSGTTGSPKGVVLSFGALSTRVQLNIAAIGKCALARTLVTLPTHFGHGLIGNALTSLMAGCDIVLYPRGASLSPRLGSIVDTHRITFMTSVPSLWRIATRFNPPVGDSLIRVHVGSAPLSAQLWSAIAEWSRAEVVNCYGMTETANWIGGASSRTEGIVEGLVGKPWGGAVAIRDDRGSIRKVGDGEIVVQSPTMMSGYLGRPDLTAAVVRDGWLYTGDRGTVDEIGRVRLTGRIKDEINRGGLKIRPAEIDMLLETHPAVSEACVFAIPDPISGECVGAAIRLENGVSVDVDSLRSWCRERLRREAIPEHWFIVEDIPRNARGKVNRDAVYRSLAKSIPGVPETVGGAGSSSFDSATKPADFMVARVREAVEQAWTKVLGKSTFVKNATWEEAGGDSLNGLRLWFYLEQGLGKRFPLEVLLPETTPSMLIARIEKDLCLSERKFDLDSDPQRLPVVFVLPTAHGDLPDLARFRAALEYSVRFVTIRYPSWSEMIDAGGGFDVLIGAAVAQSLANCDNDVNLLGNSFGGFVAFEAARRIMELGCTVSFIGLIDTRRDNLLQLQTSVVVKARKALQLIGSGVRSAPTVLLEALLRFLTMRSAFRLLRAIGHMAVLLPRNAAFTFRWRLEQQLRYGALEKWTLKPLNSPVTLFRSGDSDSDYGWSTLCSQLSIIPVGGDHLSILELPYRDILCSRFLQALDEARVKR